MLTLKPIGRGNWAPQRLHIDGSRAQPLLIRVGDRIQLAGATWRVCEVRSNA